MGLLDGRNDKDENHVVNKQACEKIYIDTKSFIRLSHKLVERQDNRTWDGINIPISSKVPSMI